MLIIADNAEAKTLPKGAGSGRSIFGVQIGGAKATSVNAEVQIQVDLFRVSDSHRVDTFTVDGKKTSSSVSTDAGGLRTTLGGPDPSSPSFQNSPLGPALNEALSQLVGEVETRSPRAVAAAPTTSGYISAQGSGGDNSQPGGNVKGSGVQAGAVGNAASANAGGRSVNLNVPSFSADTITKTGKETNTGKLWSNRNAMRLEGVDEKGSKGTTIMRFDCQVMWILVPQQKAYLEMPWAGMAQRASSFENDATVERQSLGSEQVGAYPCDKSRATVLLQGHTYTSLEWSSKDLNGFVVKAQDEKGQWSREYQNIQLGPQDPSLFELPAGYQKMGLGGMTRRPNP